MLQLMRAQDPPCPWGVWTSYAAAVEGYLSVMQWLRAQDPPCPWDRHSCHAAAEGGYLTMLQWLRAQDPPCPWNKVRHMFSGSKGRPLGYPAVAPGPRATVSVG